MSDISKAIEKITIKHPGLNARLREILSHKQISAGGTKLHCYCLKTDINGKSREIDFVHFLTDFLVDYAISPKERNHAFTKVEQQNSVASIMLLQRRARSLFTDQENSGEIGELILFILANVYLHYPILINKMSLKTSSRMHVHGSDGIHFNYDEENDVLDLYWGESKLHTSITSAIDSCFASVANFILEQIGEKTSRSRDMELIGSNLEKLDSEVLENALIKFFDIDSDFSNRVRFKGICFVGFDCEKNYVPINFQKGAEIYFQDYLAEWENKLKKGLYKYHLDERELHIFMIPFESVDRLRQEFKKAL